jgi:hypothetical protein
MTNKRFTLAEAKHYLKGSGEVEKSIWDLKKDIDSGILTASKIGNRYWVNKDTLEQTYGSDVEDLDGPGYYLLRLQGWSKEKIIKEILTPICRTNGKNPVMVAAGYESHITKKTYVKQAEEALDVSRQAEILEERLALSQKLEQKLSLGMYDEAKELKELISKREFIHAVSRKNSNGVYVQIPVTEETITEGLTASLYSFFWDTKFHKELDKENINYSLLVRDGYKAFQFFGEQDKIMDILREHISNRQPEGFSKANLEARLFIDPNILKEEKEREQKITKSRSVEIVAKPMKIKEFMKKNKIKTPQKLGKTWRS